MHSNWPNLSSNIKKYNYQLGMVFQIVFGLKFGNIYSNIVFSMMQETFYSEKDNNIKSLSQIIGVYKILMNNKRKFTEQQKGMSKESEQSTIKYVKMN